MANGRNGKRRGDAQRDGTSFVALPTVVLDSAAYLGLGYSAKALLIELARQLGRDNNGQLLATSKGLEARGWNSKHVIANALRELLSANLIHQTVKGRLPNRAAWYAVTWYALADSNKYDAGAVATFRRGAYLDTQLSVIRSPFQAPSTPSSKNTSSSADSALRGVPIGADSALEDGSLGAVSAPIKGDFGTSPSADSAHHLDIAICMRGKAKQGKGAGNANGLVNSHANGQEAA